MKLFRHTAIAACFGVTSLSGAGAADLVDAEQRNFFENRIRPALVEHCYECHSASAKKVGARLFLDSPAGMLEGGESGPSIIPGEAERSLIIHALRHEGDLEMPPDQPLPQSVIDDFTKWIAMGAPDPRSADANTAGAGTSAGKSYTDGELWSFEPIRNPTPPAIVDQSWPRDPLDHFVLAGVEKHKLRPTSDAEPHLLIRRLHFDLTGLPPSASAVDRFVASYHATGQAAVVKLVDELLASPHFGERWGRHWLDVARYAESNGNDGLSRNATFPHAWRYRDYVIDAFNRDLSYDRFLTEQIAGDLLAENATTATERDRLLTATGFLAIGSKPAKAMNSNFEMDVVADQIDAVCTGIIGLSVACARCHDHKFDPIPTRDYYALAGLFTSTETLWGIAANVSLTAPPTQLHVLETASMTLPPEGLAERIAEIEARSSKNNTPLKKEFTYPPGTPLAMGVRDRKQPVDCKINQKGDAKKLGDAVPRGFLTAYSADLNAGITVDPKQSGRLQLAQWLTSGEHPHTARVMANRIWLHLFGQAIVGTPDDFGVYGERPTHPELLDHLASRFSGDCEWSMKKMIRAIVLSRTYQLASHSDATSLAADPENRWLSRHLRRRLDAESLRDAMLSVSGQLDHSPADGSAVRHFDVLVNHAGNLHQPSDHRSIYLCQLRNSPPPELAAFDLPAALKVTGKRDQTVLPTQALFLLNSEFVTAQAEHFAASLNADLETDERIEQLWRRALMRSPDDTERASARYLLETLEPQEKARAALCQSLLASNEFRYVD